MATRDDGYDGLRAEVLATVREGYEALRQRFDSIDIGAAEVRPTPADGFTAMADWQRRVAANATKESATKSARRATAEAAALDMLAGISRAASLTWAEVRS
jgi:hypothetical protein